MWKIAMLVVLVGCGSSVDNSKAECEAAGSSLDYYGNCVWPLFRTSASPVPGPCSGVQRGVEDCTSCHTMGGPGGWHKWSPDLTPAASTMVTTGGCVLCHH
jgi:hypothetical protein